MSGYGTGYSNRTNPPDPTPPPCPHERGRVEERINDAITEVMLDEGLEETDPLTIEEAIGVILDNFEFGPLCKDCAEEAAVDAEEKEE